MRAPRAVLVDIGETLFRERPMDRRAAAEALAKDPRLAPYLPGARELEAAHAAGAEGSESWTVLGWLAAMLPLPLAEEAEVLVWESGVRMVPMPGAREALAALREGRVRVGAVSNTRFSARAWRHAIDAHGLAVDFVVSSADVGARKPDPRIFRAALDRLGLPAADVWFVGDSLEKDVRGAAAAGMRPVWFGGASAPPPATGHGASDAPWPPPPPCCAVARDWPAVRALWKRSPRGRVS